MNYCSDFRHDLQRGKVGETLFANLFREGTSFEVKRDSWAFRSGNIAIEFESRSKPSGIAKSEADYWVFVLSRELADAIMIVIETEKLRALFKLYYEKGKVKSMGDNNTSLAVLIPLKELFTHPLASM